MSVSFALSFSGRPAVSSLSPIKSRALLLSGELFRWLPRFCKRTSAKENRQNSRELVMCTYNLYACVYIHTPGGDSFSISLCLACTLARARVDIIGGPNIAKKSERACAYTYNVYLQRTLVLSFSLIQVSEREKEKDLLSLAPRNRRKRARAIGKAVLPLASSRHRSRPCGPRAFRDERI